jgi:hypothetical protein
LQEQINKNGVKNEEGLNAGAEEVDGDIGKE